MTRKETAEKLTSLWYFLTNNDYPQKDLDALKVAIKALEQEPKWIPVSERLPEEKVNPITHDYYEYQCTFRNGDIYDVRSYKFGKGHWWLGCGMMDKYVTAWMPLPEPYRAESEEKE